jgi:hypothetical protein
MTITEALERGDKWFAEHRDHVFKVLAERGKESPTIMPSGSDLGRPELWKDIHWAWYFSYRPNK